MLRLAKGGHESWSCWTRLILEEKLRETKELTDDKAQNLSRIYRHDDIRMLGQNCPPVPCGVDSRERRSCSRAR